jgi:hypothetical protein
MSTSLLDHINQHSRESAVTESSPANQLRATMAACRVSFTWLGTQKTLTREQKERAAEAFDAQGASLSAGKKLLDTTHPAYRAVTAVRGKIDTHWRGLTLPFPEPGLRLIRHDHVEEFADRMNDYRSELDDAVTHLNRHYDGLKRSAADRLGSLFNSSDYPETLVGLFGVAWDFPNIEPPDYLVQLAPGLYEQEQARVASRFEEAVQLAESAFLEEFTRLVAHLCERVSDDGSETKVFRDTAIGNLTSFFERFRLLNVRSNAQIDELVAQAQRAVRGVRPQDLRDSQSLRSEVSHQLARVRDSLDTMLVERPRRRILRSTSQTDGSD